MKLSELCQDVLDAATGAIGDPPPRRMVQVANAAVDGPMLAVFPTMIDWANPVGTVNLRPSKARVTEVPMVVRLVRPWPVARNGEVPTAAQIDDAARTLHDEAQAVAHAVTSMGRDDWSDGLCRDVVLDRSSPGGPWGGMAGWDIAVRVPLV